MFLSVLLQKYQEDLQKLGLKIEQHVDHMRFLTTQENILEEFIVDMEGMRISVKTIYYISSM